MDSGVVKFRRKDIDEMKASLGIAEAQEEITLAPPDEIPKVPAEEMPEIPEVPPASDAGLGEEIARIEETHVLIVKSEDIAVALP